MKRETILLTPSENSWLVVRTIRNPIALASYAHACLPTRNQCIYSGKRKRNVPLAGQEVHIYIPSIPSRGPFAEKKAAGFLDSSPTPAVVPSESGHHSGTHKLATGQTRRCASSTTARGVSRSSTRAQRPQGTHEPPNKVFLGRARR